MCSCQLQKNSFCILSTSLTRVLSCLTQSDVPEVRGAAAAATPALQEHAAGATFRRTLEVSGWRHPGAAHWTK